MSNFAHNALRSVCLQVYYETGSKSLKQFIAFQKTIPSNALILVATIMSPPCSMPKVPLLTPTKVRNILDIYAKYGKVIKGDKQTSLVDSENTYQMITGLFNCINADDYHGPKVHVMLKSWAQAGMYVFVSDFL